EMFTGKRVYLAGRMTVSGKPGDPARYRFFLIENAGQPLLVYFVPKAGDEWACEEAATVVVVPGTDPNRDLLFLTAFESAAHSPAGVFRRAVVKAKPPG